MFAKGETIYEYDYNHAFSDKNKGINITKHKVKECKVGRIFLQGDYGWSIRYEEIGNKFFASKESLLLAAIRANLKEAENCDDSEDLEKLISEAKHLLTKLKTLQRDDDD